MLPYISAALLLLAIVAYSTAGGADFGAGIWDLAARGRRGAAARELIDHAMAPVWEVNNVWLVLGIVVCWTGFPLLFEDVFSSLYPLFTLALLGLILRGAFFAFRHVAGERGLRRTSDVIFGISSLVTPFFFAASLGAIAGGRVGQAALAASFNAPALAFGAVSLAATALTGATFLVGDARRRGSGDLVEYFRRRGLLSVAALIAVGTAALAVLALQAPALLRSMFSWPAAVFTAAAMILTPAVGGLLFLRVYRFYRLLTVAAVTALVAAWAVAQAPYLLPGRLTIAAAAAPAPTQVLLLVAAAVVIFVIGPGIALLLVLDQRNLLESPQASLEQPGPAGGRGRPPQNW